MFRTLYVFNCVDNEYIKRYFQYQIENNIRLNINLDNIDFYTNFDYEYKGVKTTNIDFSYTCKDYPSIY